MMYKILLGVLACTILLAACEESAPTFNECQAYCDQPPAEQVVVQEDACLFCGQAYIDYFTVESIDTRVEDTDCDSAFEGRRNASDYLCSIKRAEPLRKVGRSAEGADQWQWRIDCACSYSS